MVDSCAGSINKWVNSEDQNKYDELKKNLTSRKEDVQVVDKYSHTLLSICHVGECSQTVLWKYTYC